MHPRVTTRTLSEENCDFCGGRRTGDRLAQLGLEATPLERGPAHVADCPLLHPNRSLRMLAVAAALAVIPVVAPHACQANSPITGLDDGTVGRADDSVGGTSLAS